MGEKAVPSNMAELLVVRHGETSWNALGRLQGHAESDLNDAGKKQALAVAEKLASMGLHFDAIYSSDLQRALDTAKAIADKCKCSKLIVRKNLRERCLGDLEGLTRTEARTAAPEALKAFMKNDDSLPIPGGGESIEQLCVRVQDAFEQVASENLGKRVVLVTHGGVLRTSHIIASGLPCTGKVVNASINTFRISEDKDWAICSWGEVSHLEDIGFLNTGFGGDKLSGDTLDFDPADWKWEGNTPFLQYSSKRGRAFLSDMKQLSKAAEIRHSYLGDCCYAGDVRQMTTR